MTVLVTGAAGFIGAAVSRALLARGERVVGVDNLNDYYDVGLKRARLGLLGGDFRFVEADVSDRAAMAALVDSEPAVDRVVHLAAQAGVRHSMVDPYAYVTANVMGHVVMLEAVRRLPALRHFVFASSSSVYGLEGEMPFSEGARADTPTSLYAATKRADELISHAYGHLWGIRQTGLRFFTVYGPWGRPDMAVFMFARAIVEGRPVTLYEGGRLQRDFTYIDDIVAGVLGVLDRPPEGAMPRLLNIGNSRREEVSKLVALLEAALGRRAVVEWRERPAADVRETWASVAAIEALTGYVPRVSLEEGVGRFVAWFTEFRGGMQKGG
ncbi:MAG: SDR family NAD(P)-dependent oxidoreductase [Janthinobacterium lividum]